MNASANCLQSLLQQYREKIIQNSGSLASETGLRLDDEFLNRFLSTTGANMSGTDD